MEQTVSSTSSDNLDDEYEQKTLLKLLVDPNANIDDVTEQTLRRGISIKHPERLT